jgi:hypothetical protein
MVSDLDPVPMIFALFLFNNYLATSTKCLGGSTINIHRNYNGFCIGSALMDSFYRTTFIQSHALSLHSLPITSLRVLVLV